MRIVYEPPGSLGEFPCLVADDLPADMLGKAYLIIEDVILRGPTTKAGRGGCAHLTGGLGAWGILVQFLGWSDMTWEGSLDDIEQMCAEVADHLNLPFERGGRHGR